MNLFAANLDLLNQPCNFSDRCMALQKRFCNAMQNTNDQTYKKAAQNNFVARALQSRYFIDYQSIIWPHRPTH